MEKQNKKIIQAATDLFIKMDFSGTSISDMLKKQALIKV